MSGHRVSRTDMKRIVDWARDQGCEISLTRHNKYYITYGGEFVGTVAPSASDGRAVLNAKSSIRRNLARIKEAQP